MKTKPVKFEQKFEIPPPIVNIAIPVSDWEILIEKIKKIRIPLPIYPSMGTLFIGAGISIIFSLYPFYSIFLFILGGVFLAFAYSKRNEVEQRKEDVLDFITSIERRCREHLPTTRNEV